MNILPIRYYSNTLIENVLHFYTFLWFTNIPVAGKMSVEVLH